MRVLRSTPNKITEDKNGKNVPYLEIAKVIQAAHNFPRKSPTDPILVGTFQTIIEQQQDVLGF